MLGLKISPNHLYFLTRLLVLLILLLTIVNINKFFANKKILGVAIDTVSVNEQKNYYQKLIQDNPTYIDGYLELAKIEKFLGDNEGANAYLQKAQSIDPNRILQ